LRLKQLPEPASHSPCMARKSLYRANNQFNRSPRLFEATA